MKSRPQNRGLSYYRRSDDKQETSLGQQHGWARETADKMGVVFRGTLADVERMQQQKLSHHQDIYIADAITGGDLSRPGFLQFLADAKADSTVSTVFVFKRDRLARPQDVLQMVALERDLILSGVTLVTHDRVFTPEDVKANDIVYLITSLIEYQQHGKFSPQLGDRMIFVQAAMAVKGYSTGGRAPFGFARGLVGPDDQFVQWLEDGEKIRRPGHHVRFLPYDVDKLRTWVMMLEWRAAGDGYKRITRKLNELGIAAPDAGRVRRDHGQRHHVPGKWHPTTVRDLCSNPLIAGIKQYAKRSMGRYRRVGPDGPRELTEADRGPGDQPRTLENPLELRVRADSGGEAFVDAATWDAIQPKGRTQEEGRRAGGRKPNNPDRYPLSTRIIDLTDGRAAGCTVASRASDSAMGAVATSTPAVPSAITIRLMQMRCSNSRPRGPACRCGGGGARCPTSAPVGDPADPPVGSHRRRARHGGPRRSRRVARHATRQSGHPGVLPGPVGRTRCRRRRWHR